MKIRMPSSKESTAAPTTTSIDAYFNTTLQSMSSTYDQHKTQRRNTHRQNGTGLWIIGGFALLLVLLCVCALIWIYTMYQKDKQRHRQTELKIELGYNDVITSPSPTNASITDCDGNAADIDFEPGGSVNNVHAVNDTVSGTVTGDMFGSDGDLDTWITPSCDDILTTLGTNERGFCNTVHEDEIINGSEDGNDEITRAGDDFIPTPTGSINIDQDVDNV